MLFRLIIVFLFISGMFYSSKGNLFANKFLQANDSVAKQDSKTVDRLKKEKQLYEKNCIVCHGTMGKGDGAAGLYLNPRPFDISSEKVQSQNDSILFYKITMGKAPMPTFKTLSFEARQLLLLYVRELGKINK